MEKASKFSFIIIIAICMASFQILKPIKWTFSTSKAGAKPMDTIDLIFKGKLDAGWYVYGSELKVEGPMPTEIDFENNGAFQLVGKLKTVNAKEKYDEIWDGKISYFIKEATFIQKVKILKPISVINGKISCQTCTEKDGKCIPNKDKFAIKI